jgi:hypothetical protein
MGLHPKCRKIHSLKNKKHPIKFLVLYVQAQQPIPKHQETRGGQDLTPEELERKHTVLKNIIELILQSRALGLILH